MPLDFSSKAEPVGSGVLDFSAKAVPVQKKTRQEVEADVAQAQMRRDVMSPPEEMSGLETFAANPIVGGVANIASLQPVMHSIGEIASIPMNHFAEEAYGPRPKPFVINRDTGELTQEKGYDSYFGAGKPLFNVPMAHPEQMGVKEVSPLPSALAQALEGLGTIENVATLPATAGKNVAGKVLSAVVAPQMISGGIEQAKEVFNPDRTSEEKQQAGYGAAINLLLGGKVGKGLVDSVMNQPLRPEVLPPIRKGPLPEGRQLEAPVIDVEIVQPKQLPLVSETMLESIRNPEPIDRTYGGKPVKPPEYLLPREQRPVRITPPPEESVVKAEPKEVPFQNETRPLAEAPLPKSDYQQYLDVQKKIGALVEKGDFESAEFRQLWQENENIKNRHGGMPPAKDTVKGEVKPPAEPGENGRLYLNPIGPIVKQTVKDVTTVGKKVGKVGADFIRAYAEPLQEQIGRVGGVVSKKVSEEAGQIISRGKELYGELTPVVDVAKKQVGKAYRGGTGWMRELSNVTPNAAQNNFFAANESGVVVPLNARRGMKLAADANLKIGQMAQRANPGFTASGKLQRIMTSEGYDMIVKGGEGREKWMEGVAQLNNVPIAQVQNFFEKMKQTLGDPASSSASLDQINQDFVRKFPKTITHVKTPTGWHEVIVSDPFNYLEQAAQRTAHATAFREVYPLIQHQGKWVQSGKLQATRKAVMKELKDGGDIAKFDNLMKALQGHPLDTFSSGVSTTAKSVGGTIAGPLKAMMLSGNFATNLGEVVSGGPSIFLGYKSVGQGLAEMVKDPSFYEQLELTGARNKTIYNNAFDSSAPVRSVSRQAGNVVRNVTGQQFLNEVQEGMAAASAKVYADRVKSGTMSQYESNRANALFRAMGFNKEQATAMVGGDAALLKQFENRAASWLTTGNQAPAEMSRLGASRLFNSVFWFHKYPQMTLNQFRSVGGNLIDDAKAYTKAPSKQTWSPLYHNAVLMGRQLGGRSAQGAITIAILAGVSGGIYGLVQTKREAEEDVMKFVGEGIVSGYGGPLSVMKRLGQNVKGGDSFVKEIASLSAPASVTSEMIDMGMGVGKYEGLNTPEKVGKFLEEKTPASRMMKTGMAVAGLSEKDLEFEVAVKGFYKWRREQSGQTKTSVVGGTDEQIEMRAGMQKVKKAIEAGEDWVAELRKVRDLKGAGNALRAGTLLQVNGKALNESQLEALKRRIGAKGLEKIQARDAMIREVGRELNEKQESGERKTAEMVEQPKGNLAIDRETEGQRNERVTNRLSPKVRDYLKQNEMENLGYTPAIPRGIKKQQLTVEEARKMEEEYVKVVDQLVGTLVDYAELKKANLKVRQEVIGKMLESSRKVASAKTLGLLEGDKSR